MYDSATMTAACCGSEGMVSNAMFAQVAALAGDPARAAMLHELMDGRALTASELARVARVTPQTASGHLAQMTTVGLLLVEKQGRHRYHKLASAAVARMLEGIMQVASDLEPTDKRLTVGPRDAALRAARTCYDHLAGHLGVAIADAMIGRGFVELEPDGGLVTRSGIEFLARVGIAIAPPAALNGKISGRLLCRPCLDWSERRRISPVRLALRSVGIPSTEAGYAASMGRAQSPSRPRANRCFASSSEHGSDSESSPSILLHNCGETAPVSIATLS